MAVSHQPSPLPPTEAGGAAEAVRRAVRELPPSDIREVAHLGMGKEGVIPLYFGEPDVPTPGFICKAAAQALEDGDTFYQPNRGIPELRETLARYTSGLYGAAVAPDNITVTVSGLNGLMIALQCLIEPSDVVVTTAPLWPNLTAMPKILGAEVREVALDATDTGWRLDLERLLAACDERVKAILLNSPNNPTGWLMSAEEQRAILDFARRRGIWILSDEVYARIVYDRPYAPSFLEHTAPEDRVIVVNSFSKSWAMTGWRLGWLTAPASLAPVFEKVMEFNISCPAGFVQRAGVMAVEQGEPFIKDSVARYGRARDLVVQRSAALPRVALAYPEAAFYAFFSVAGVSDTLGFAKRCLAETGVGLAPGEAFGRHGSGHLRICYAASVETLHEAFDRLAPLLD